MKYAKNASTLLRAVAAPMRIRILSLLTDHESNVGDLAAHLGLSQSALSQHLKTLRDAGAVVTRRKHQEIWYRRNHDDAYITRLIDPLVAWWELDGFLTA